MLCTIRRETPDLPVKGRAGVSIYNIPDSDRGCINMRLELPYLSDLFGGLLAAPGAKQSLPFFNFLSAERLITGWLAIANSGVEY